RKGGAKLMRETGIGTSLFLIATGAVLAFAINVQSTAIDINTIGAILMVVGIIGLMLSFIVLGSWGAAAHDDHIVYDDDPGTTAHEHRRVQTRDVVYENDDAPTRVERVREIRR